MPALANTRTTTGGSVRHVGLTQSVRELIGILDELRAQVETISHLERLKTHAISARDLDSLAEITQREESGNEALRALEQQRHALVRGFYAEGEIEPTIQQLASRLAGPTAEELRVAGEALRSTIDDLRQLTRRNEGLLGWAADLARSTAQWLLGYGQAAPAYTRFGDRQSEPALSARNWNA